MVQIDTDACRSWARSWSDWSTSLTVGATALAGRLAELQLGGEGDVVAASIADSAGELARSSLYLSLVATEAERADRSWSDLSIGPIALLAFDAHGALPPGTAADFERTTSAHLAAALEQEAFERDVRLMSVDEINDRMLTMPPDVLSVVLMTMNDIEFANLVDLIDGQNYASRDDQGEVLVALGETVSLDVWRRMGQYTEVIDPDPSTAISDSARDDPASADKFDRLVYHDFSGWTLFGSGASAPDPTEFRQGSIGDCYLIAAMITLGNEDAAALGSIVQPNANGTFTVTFADGSRQVVSPDLVVDPDDFIETPGGTRYYTPEFATTEPGGALFPALVEKAYAQENLGYDNISGGSSSAAIEVLTGRQGGWIDNDDIDIDDLAARFDSGESLGLSTIDRPDGVSNSVWKADPDTPETFKNSFGGTYERLHQNHAFIVVDVDAAAGTVSVVNPWNPSRPPFDLTEAELQESVNGVRTNEAP